MMQDLQKMYDSIQVPPNLKEDILTYCRTAQEKPAPVYVRYAKPLALVAACAVVLFITLAATDLLPGGGSSLPLAVPSEPASSESVDETTTQATTTTAQAILITSSQPESEPEPTQSTDGTTSGLCFCTSTQPPSRKTTVRTEEKATETSLKQMTTTTLPDAHGGDQNACTEHVLFYHGIDGRLIDYVGSVEVHTYLEKNGWLNTAHLTKEEREQITVLRFLKDFAITKQEFIAAMQWENILDEKPEPDGYYNAEYTYREHADAIYSDDPERIEEVFGYVAGHVSSTVFSAQQTLTATRKCGVE